MVMKQREIRLDALSDIEFRATLLEDSDDSFYAISVAFTGSHGYGSRGNGDSQYISAMVHAALAAWRPSGLILDFRELTYEFGNGIADAIFAARDDDSGDWLTPTRIVVSSACRAGISSLLDFLKLDPSVWLFDTVEGAYEAVRQLAHED
jgi:hypothetical protein